MLRRLVRHHHHLQLLFALFVDDVPHWRLDVVVVRAAV